MNEASKLDVTALIASLTATDGNVTWVDTSSRPREMDRLGTAVAETVAEAKPQAIACWYDPDEVVFAHTVARVLDVPVVRLDLDLGLLSLDPALQAGTERVLVLATCWTASRPVDTLLALLDNLGVGVVSVLSLVSGEVRPESLPVATPFVVLGQS